MAVLFRDRLALAKTQLLEAACEDKERMSSIHVRPLQGILRGFIDSLTMEAKVNLSEEIMEVAFASKDAELLLATLFPASGPENKKRTGSGGEGRWPTIVPSRRKRINGFQAAGHNCEAHPSWLTVTPTSEPRGVFYRWHMVSRPIQAA